MTKCPCLLHKVLSWAQRREASPYQPPFLSSAHCPGRDLALSRACPFLSGNFFFVAGCCSPYMPAEVLAVVEAMLASFTRTCQTFCSAISHFVVRCTVAALDLVEVLASLEVDNLLCFAHLLGGDVGCDCFKIDHCRKSLSLFVLFTDIRIPCSIVYVKCFEANL